MFPLQTRGKKPRSIQAVAHAGGLELPSKPRGGFHQASREPEVIRRWWERWPRANIGCAVPPRRVILDLDSREAPALLEGLGLPLPPTATIRTGRGLHLHYGLAAGLTVQQINLAQALAARPSSSSNGIPPGAEAVELRTAGKGYGILPPSVHPSGAVYTLECSSGREDGAGLWRGIASAPGWLAELFGVSASKPAGRQNGHHSRKRLGIPIPAGERDQTLYRYACSLRARNCDWAEAELLLRHRWGDAEQPSGDPYSWEVAREKLTRAWKLPAGCSPPYSVAARNQNQGGSGANSVKSVNSVSEDDDQTSTTTEEVPFAELTPLHGPLELPTFPVDAFPPAVGAFVQEVAASVQAPVDLPALLALGVLAAAGSHALLWVEVGHLAPQPVCLYLAPVMNPSERKSSAFRFMVEPLESFEVALRQQHRSELPRAQELRAAEEIHIRLLRKQAGEAPELEERQSLARQAADAAGNLAALPPEPCMLAADVTQEGLAVRLQEQGGRLAVFDTEGSVFSIALGRYASGSPSFEVLLRGWSADSLRIDRKGSTRIRVQRPVLTVCVPIQPEILRQLGEKRETITLGLMSRFLFALPPSRIGTRRFEHRPISEAARKRYGAAVGRLLALPSPPLATPESTPWRLLRLEGDALDRWATFYNRTEEAMAPGGALAALADWGGKLPANVARIAALFHAVESTGGRPGSGQPWDEPIKVEAVEQAVKVGTYLQAHALAAYQSLGGDPQLALAVRAWEHICRNRWETFSLRQLYRALGEQTKVVEAAIQLLKERGYVRRLPARRRAAGARGQHPSPRFQVRPGLLTNTPKPY